MIFAYSKEFNRIVHVDCTSAKLTVGSVRECRDRHDDSLWCSRFVCTRCGDCAPKNNSLQVAHNWEVHLWGPPTMEDADIYCVPWK